MTARCRLIEDLGGDQAYVSMIIEDPPSLKGREQTIITTLPSPYEVGEIYDMTITAIKKVSII